MMPCACCPTVGKTHYGGLFPLPSSGLRWARRRNFGRVGFTVRAHLDADSLRHALEAAISSAHPSLQPQLADIGSHALNFMHSIAEEAALTGTGGLDINDAAATVSAAANEAGQAAADAADAANGSGGGVAFEGLAVAFTKFLEVIGSGLEQLHVPYSFGFAIIVLTVIVKVVTFPLTQRQVESSINMRALQPRLAELQTKYKNDPETLQKKTAALYQEAGVNPLSGCLPTLATIPVFIALYRALLLAADEGLLKDGFFWIPSLAGPTTISARQAGLGLSWLLPFQDGAPPIGWDDAKAYLVLPVLLIISQYISQAIIQQKNDEPSQRVVQALLKFLPIMLGYFSLNVPSGLTLYWITNNLLSTGQQAYLMGRGKPVVEPQVSAATVVKPRTQVADVKPKGKELGSRKSPKKIAAAEERYAVQQRKSRKGEKFRSRRSQETARKAAKLASKQNALQPEMRPIAADNMLANAPSLELEIKEAPAPEAPGSRVAASADVVEAEVIEPPTITLDAQNPVIEERNVMESVTVDHSSGAETETSMVGSEVEEARDDKSDGEEGGVLLSQVQQAGVMKSVARGVESKPGKRRKKKTKKRKGKGR